MFAEIIVNLPVEGTFHYHIPPDLANRLQRGHLVQVTFGQQKAQGVVLDFSLHAPVRDTRPVEALIDRKPVVSQRQLALAGWLSEAYLTPLADCVRLFIPPGMSKRGDILISPVIDPDMIEPRDDTQARLLKLLKRHGSLRGRQIERSMPRRNWRRAVADLVERGLAQRDPVLAAPTVNAKQVRVAGLGIPADRVEEVIARRLLPDDLPANRQVVAHRRARILRLLASAQGPLAVGDIYTTVEGSGSADLQRLAEDDLISLHMEEVWRDSLADRTFVPDTPPRLTTFQQQAWEAIAGAMDGSSPQPILLHGVTGSGKTELYLRAVKKAIERGQQAIVLVPEIALTPQTVQRFGARFPGRMGLIHSGLSAGERYDTWRRARSGLVDLVIGPRSALFTPMENLGLIVIDECHDDSYKQSPPIPPPYYHALPVAVEQARLHGALVILGSATPNLDTYALAAPPGSERPGGYTLLELPARIMGHRHAIQTQALHFHLEGTRYTHHPEDPDEAVMIDLPPVQVVDMRQELRAGNRSIFSRVLVAALTGTLKRGEQAILFLNRRGTATYVFCRACGHVMACPRCDIPLTWHTSHGDSHTEEGVLVCHQCSHRAAHPARCPSCGSEHIRFFGGGTERVEGEVRRQFPGVRVTRWDRDTTGGRYAHDALLDQFISHRSDVLVGTQMVAKGLDLPLVTLVGVVSADTALYLPDYRSSERTFQLLTQVSGRAGRGLLGGSVILQTYTPDHYAILAASEHDFHRFYKRELAYRQELGYPPFSRLARLEIRAAQSEDARQEAGRLHTLLSQRIAENHLVQTTLIGPAPCFYARREGLYRWHIVVRGPNPSSILGDVRSAHGLSVDIDPVSLL
jgi:primosomal protein N' (replication factor Y)